MPTTAAPQQQYGARLCHVRHSLSLEERVWHHKWSSRKQLVDKEDCNRRSRRKIDAAKVAGLLRERPSGLDRIE
eukprot:47851-Eustigmatos_ZCMA.PRE.1